MIFVGVYHETRKSSFTNTFFQHIFRMISTLDLSICQELWGERVAETEDEVSLGFWFQEEEEDDDDDDDDDDGGDDDGGDDDGDDDDVAVVAVVAVVATVIVKSLKSQLPERKV